ncbi:LytR/AlgR family response regulator transcription factor [Aurantibacillus circumpalustris]|uniref:LytR/AlgR family response regulator transcription factor n=1 Tax=Aurantibacillus circumpalustris TaxID=3036359 RepID=UPI00295A893E|nr:LytTR family DNA-binding domain-containing protein [Aurantibacillus circumpalustris]
MILRAIIIDDEQKGIETLSLLIDMYVKDVKVVASCTSAIESIELIESYRPEIIFLDVNMPELNGFELLEKITWKDFNLIFVTAHQEYALRAIKNNAIDYLLKPVDYDDLQNAVERIKMQLNTTEQPNKYNYNELLGVMKQTQKQTIVINTRFGIESIDTDDIFALESQSNYTKIHLVDMRTVVSSKTLKDFETQLCLAESNFMRVHHSFIINLKRVSKYLKNSENIVLTNDQQIPLSKSKKDNFIRWLNI